MKSILWKNRFITANILALAILKLAFALPPSEILGLIGGVLPFSSSDVVTKTNVFRSSLGLLPLKENEQLNIAAQKKLQDMMRNQYFAHVSPSGVSPWRWFTDSNYRYSYAGENLALGYDDSQEVVAAWADSPTHRRNMANPNYRDIGIAVGRADIDGVQGIVIVQLFGTPSVQVATKPAKTTLPTTTKPSQTAIPVVVTPQTVISATIAAAITSPAAIVNSYPTAQTSPASPVDSLTLNLSAMTKPSQLLRNLNRGFALYSILILTLVLRYLYSATERRVLFGRTAVYATLCLVAILLPPLELARLTIIV